MVLNMEKYILNHSNGKLHRESCTFVKDAFHQEKAFLMDEVLKNYHKRVTCCKRCLRSDSAAQKFVETHNAKNSYSILKA